MDEHLFFYGLKIKRSYDSTAILTRDHTDSTLHFTRQVRRY